MLQNHQQSQTCNSHFCNLSRNRCISSSDRTKSTSHMLVSCSVLSHVMYGFYVVKAVFLCCETNVCLLGLLVQLETLHLRIHHLPPRFHSQCLKRVSNANKNTKTTIWDLTPIWFTSCQMNLESISKPFPPFYFSSQLSLSISLHICLHCQIEFA